MKSVALVLAALAFAPAMAGELVSHDGDDTIRLAEGECTSESVLSKLPPELRAQFRAASAVLQGRSFAACWHITPRGAHLIYEDGDEGLVPFDALKPLLSV